jgi:hypothetical protein
MRIGGQWKRLLLFSAALKMVPTTRLRELPLAPEKRSLYMADFYAIITLSFCLSWLNDNENCQQAKLLTAL